MADADGRFMKISKICLGTAQLGIEYGINNLRGKPGLEESRAIIAEALRNGIDAFDTAPAYGDSEKILGRCLEDLRADAVVISKLPRLDWEKPSEEIRGEIRASLERTLAHLRISRLPVCLFHRFEDIGGRDGLALQELIRLRDQGLIEKLGASIYTPEEAGICLGIDGLDVIQSPFNLADKRPLDSGFFRSARRKGVTILVRSVFLQGLFFREEIPENLRPFEVFRRNLREICAEEGLGMAQLALRYPLGFEEIDSILIGLETLGQLRENIEIIREGPLPAGIMEKINRLGTADAKAVDPRRWTEAA